MDYSIKLIFCIVQFISKQLYDALQLRFRVVVLQLLKINKIILSKKNNSIDLITKLNGLFHFKSICCIKSMQAQNPSSFFVKRLICKIRVFRNAF